MGEGAGFIVLKRLKDALHDKNKIYAIISGYGGSSDGKGKGITAPNPEGQRLAIERALKASGIKSSDIQYLECHGTSTIVGDATELNVLKEIFSDRNSDQKLAIGSIKSQIGHLKSASGIAGIIKTVLALHNKIIPPSINYVTPNPSIDWDTSPYYVNTEPKNWISPSSGVRRAGVSAFGFGGTNYHIILEEFLPQLYGESFSRSSEPSTELSFLFSGQGSQYVGMAKDLYQNYQIVRNTLDKANEICKSFADFDLLEIIFGSSNLSQEENSQRLRQTEYTQPAIYSVEMALVDLFKAEGIKPGIVGGHSLGEVAALATAGVLSFEDGLKTVITRGRAMKEVPSGVQCSMAAIFTSSEIVENTLNEISSEDVSISNYNSLSQIVISGEVSAIENAVKIFSDKGIRALKLNVSNAFHSKFVAHAEEKLKMFHKSITFKSPKIPVFSNVTGNIYPENPDEIKSILLKQITSPVRWVEEVRNIYRYGGRKFLEIGPKKALFFFTKDILKQYKEIEVNFSLSPKSPEGEQINKIIKKFKHITPQRIERPSPTRRSQKSSKRIETSKQVELSVVSSPNELNKLKQLPFFNTFLEEQKELLSTVLINGFHNFIQKYQPFLEKQYSIHGKKFDTDSVVVTGVGIGLPGKNRKVFDDKNIDDILQGINFIETINDEYQDQLLKKNITRLEKSPNGNAKFMPVDDISKVIHLAGQLGDFNPIDDYQINPKLLDALDITFQLAICAGLEALKDAGIPLIRSKIKTSTGKILSGDWVLPEELQNNTGIIFASAFPGYDNLVKEISKPKDENFDRTFLFRVLSMGHSQFAQLIKAKGPNTATNAACASTPQAIGIAEDWIRTERCKRVIVITADNVTSNNLFQWIGSGFLASGAATTKSKWEEAVLPFGEGRNGIILGAGASAFVIEKGSEAKARGVKPIVEILGSSFTNSAYHGTRLDSNDINQKLNDFVLKMEKKHSISRDELVKEGMFVSHETYSPARGGSAESELNALKEVFGEKAYDMTIINTKGYTGHAMGAGIEEVVAIKSMEKGIIPPIANLDRIDPNYSKFNFSKGSKERKKYALRFAAGFGSQVAIVLFRLKSFENRFTDSKYENWLQSMGGSESKLFMDSRVLKMNVELVSTTPASNLSLKTSKIAQKSSTIGRGDILSDIKQIISTITGYDTADIEETYDLEEDLGIDTVKQAEIFGEIREKWKIEVDESFNLADYRTINDIVHMINEFLGSETTSQDEIPIINMGVLEDVLIKIISEKTGYDIEDIDVNFDLEEDLGIDTVKQAEIFGELRDYLKIPENTEINLVELKSINDITSKILGFLKDMSFKPDTNILQGSESSEIKETSDVNEINNLVKKIIANITGYDIIDIENSYDLEEDLGIDTVKQAEIFGELRTYYTIDESIEINLSEIRTPFEIVEFIKHHVNKSTKLSEAKLDTVQNDVDSFEESEKKEEDMIYVSQVVPSRIFNLFPSDNPKSKRVETLLININSGLSNFIGLQEALNKVGFETHTFELLGEASFVKSLQNKESENYLYDNLKAIVLVVPDGSQYSHDDSLNFFDSLFIIFQSLNISILEKIIVISPETYFGWEKDANSLSSSICAFIKTINREFEVQIKLIYSIKNEQIIHEILAWDKVEEVSYKDNNRFTLLRKRIREYPEQQDYKITTEDILLATGGAQGITYACIDELTNYVKPKLILLGLAPYDDSLHKYLNYTSELLDEVKQDLTKKMKSEEERVTPVMIKREWKNFLDKLDTLRNIKNLEKKGLSVQYYTGDVTNHEQMLNIFRQIQEKNEDPITIIVHGAGIEESKSFLKKNLKMAHKVVDVKVAGFFNVLNNLQIQYIKYFVAFSSIAGRYGNQGQIDYAFANAYLSRLAWNFTQRKIPFLTIDWTAWADIGMATQGSTLQILSQVGVVPVPSKVGVKIFSKLVLNNFKGEYLVAGKLGLFEKKLDIVDIIDKSEFPMLNRITYTSDFIIGANTLNTEFDNYLLDHQIQQKPVFPGVMVLESFAEFSIRVFGKPLKSISNVNFSAALKIPVDKSVEIELKYNKSNDSITVFSITYPQILKGKPLIKEHFNAQFDKPFKQMEWKKAPICKPIIPLLDKNEIYEIFFHGDKFQVLKEIYQLENGQIISKIDIPTESLTSNSEGDIFQLDPLAIECIFQTAALFDIIVNNHFSLPSKISNLEILSKQKPCYAVAKFLKVDEERSYYNAVILSENQDIIIKIKNLEIIHAPISAELSKRLSDYLLTLKEYHLIRNGNLTNSLQILPIDKIKQKYQENPNFLDLYLTENEIKASKRFKNEKRKLEYFSGILASKECYLKQSPTIISYHDVEVQKDEKGKPFLYSNKETQKIPIYLSISHSNEFSVAIIGKNSIGIDLELIESRAPSFYKEVFTESERKHILENDKLGTIYWTAKEAFSKAIGEGLHINFRDIELKYNEKQRKFSVKLNNDQPDINKKYKKIRIKSEITEKYVLTYCEI